MRRFSRPRHATVVAYIALFSGLGGGAYAAATITGADIVDGSVTSADVEDHTLTGFDVLDGTVAGSDLAWKSVNGNKVVDGSLSGLDIGANALNAGHLKDGSVGSSEIADSSVGSSEIADGSVGPADLAPNAEYVPHTQKVQAKSPFDSQNQKMVQVSCPPGWAVVGGGAASGANTALVINQPNGNGWWAMAEERDETDCSWSLWVDAICLTKVT